MPAATRDLPDATFGDLLKRLRQRARLTQEELGLAVGYSRAHVARLESGQRTPDPSAVKARFLEALDLSGEPDLAERLVALAIAAHAAPLPGGPPEPHEDSSAPNNLPVQLTSFIGRERQLEELACLLPSTRLLTLTGAGGTGKTRLALQLAGRALRQYPDGVWLVELAPLADAGQVPQAAAAALGVRAQHRWPILDALVEHLRARRLLLILDNCEHLLEACALFVDRVLRACPEVRILATSREALGIAGEISWRVPSLKTPAPGVAATAETLALCEAARLFAARAALAAPGFDLTDANAPAVARICRRLDGIPLALELAAARVAALSADDIARRLDDRFRLLTSGNRAAPPRQQTLRGAIDWSYRLLTEPERALLRRLAVFAGGCSADAAEAVCADSLLPAPHIVPLLLSLVDKSVVMADEAQADTRYSLLETIRQYALERLADVEEEESASIRDRHLDYFIRFGERSMQEFYGARAADQAALIKRVECDLDNARRAMDWAAETRRHEDGLRLANAWLHVFILRVGHPEILDRLERLLAQAGPPHRTRAQAWSLINVADLRLRQSEAEQAGSALEQARAIGLALGDPDILTSAESGMALQAHERGEHALARALWNCVRERAAAGNRLAVTLVEDESFVLGNWALSEGDFPQALRLLAQSYDFVLARSDTNSVSTVTRPLGYALLYQGDFAQAAARLRQSLDLNLGLGTKQAAAACLAAFGALALARGDLAASARLFGASEAACESIRTPLMNMDEVEVRRNTAILRQRMDPAALAAAWAEGRAMTLDEAVACARADADRLTG
jgi:predicted ATPase/DNA-binding XRE family transcriptional regulator